VIIKVEIPEVPTQTIQASRIAKRLFLGDGPADYVDHALLENMVRLTENASHEYMRGREATIHVWSGKPRGSIPIGHAFRASMHFETCLSDIHRAIKHFDVVRKRCYEKSKLKYRLPSNLNIDESSFRDCIQKMRNTNQHKEEKLLCGKLAPGEPFAASSEDDEVQMQDSGNITKIINRIALGIDRIDF
jgi:hypothetical protein